MTNNEFLSLIKSRGGHIFPAASASKINIANEKLQRNKNIMLPGFLIDLYQDCGGITLGSASIFGPIEIQRGVKYPLPAISNINLDLTTNKTIPGKAIFGRNDLFFFAYDINGTCFMLDNLTLSILRKYDDPYRAMTDCLIVGKI